MFFPAENQQPILGGSPFFQRRLTIFIGRETKNTHFTDENQRKTFAKVSSSNKNYSFTIINNNTPKPFWLKWPLLLRQSVSVQRADSSKQRSDREGRWRDTVEEPKEQSQPQAARAEEQQEQTQQHGVFSQGFWET